MTTTRRLGPAFAHALTYAFEVHDGHVRKGTDVPYVSHLLAVTGLVLEAGGDESAEIAALLHDAAEDRGGAGRLADIAARFGDGVAGVVAELSDTVEDPKPPWRQRKGGLRGAPALRQ